MNLQVHCIESLQTQSLELLPIRYFGIQVFDTVTDIGGGRLVGIAVSIKGGKSRNGSSNKRTLFPMTNGVVAEDNVHALRYHGRCE